MSAIVTQGKLFEPLRDFSEKHSPDFWKYLTSCMQCLPFWVGILVSILHQAPLQVNQEAFPLFLNRFFTYLLCGSLYSGTSMLIHTLFMRLKQGS